MLRSKETTKERIISKLCQKLVREASRMPRFESDADSTDARGNRRTRTIPTSFDLTTLDRDAVALLISPERFRAALVQYHAASAEEQQRMVPSTCQGAPSRRKGNKELWTEMVPLDRTYLWTVDFDSSAIMCNLPLLVEQGATVHAEVGGPGCQRHGVCTRRLHVLGWDSSRGISLDSPNPARLIKRFRDHYSDDEEFRRVDAFLCSYPAANCELFVSFNKPLIIYVTGRLEFGRFDPKLEWRRPLIDPLTHSRQARRRRRRTRCPQ